MTKKQIAFCRAFFEYPNGAEAARLAGYSKRTARQIAWKIRHRSRVDFEALHHAYSVIRFPGWLWDINGRLLPPGEETKKAHAAFMRTVDLPAWFLADVQEGRYTLEKC
jgi:hypothetical protein